MNLRPEEWRDDRRDAYFPGWTPIIGVYQPNPLPPEFRQENEDLRIPLREDQLDQLQNYWYYLP